MTRSNFSQLRTAGRFIVCCVFVGMQCLVRICQERQCGGDPRLTVQLPDRASPKQPTHYTLCEPSGRSLQVDLKCNCTELHSRWLRKHIKRIVSTLFIHM